MCAFWNPCRYYVTIPFKFYDYLDMPDCSDSNRDAFK